MTETLEKPEINLKAVACNVIAGLACHGKLQEATAGVGHLGLESRQ